MNAAHFRELYEYHRALNRRVWFEAVMPLPEAQYRQPLPYSVGSIQQQMVHLMTIEDRWFAGLRGDPLPDFARAEDYPDRAGLRAAWDAVEDRRHEYLAALRDADLPVLFADSGLAVWQVLFHVLNHATDHRAQTLALLHGLGAPTFPQDYAIYLWQKGG
ncbi:MAG: DinB family protein [Anaerolineae bacterium]|jgi:uncharacterized damage-inducible protein DinB|nr:DinB family protein [Anaerolineae bacterium]